MTSNISSLKISESFEIKLSVFFGKAKIPAITKPTAIISLFAIAEFFPVSIANYQHTLASNLFHRF